MEAEKFTVHLEAAEPGFGDYLVRFPSARPVGNRANDLVSMEWYAARGPDKRFVERGQLWWCTNREVG